VASAEWDLDDVGKKAIAGFQKVSVKFILSSSPYRSKVKGDEEVFWESFPWVRFEENSERQ
jgi:hypothetical protein